MSATRWSPPLDQATPTRPAGLLKCGDRPVDPRWVLSDELIARAKGGDREALGAMFREYHPAILRYLKGVSLSNAEDVAGQVWVDAASSLRRFDGNGDDLRRWLFTIARRRMIDSFRSRSRRPEVAMAEPPARPTTGGAEDSLERLAWAEEVLRRLPPAQAEVVVLRVIVGLFVMFAIWASPIAPRFYRKRCDGLAAGRVAHLRIAAQLADDHDLV